jgi:hypothetical protein
MAMLACLGLCRAFTTVRWQLADDHALPASFAAGGPLRASDSMCADVARFHDLIAELAVGGL